MTPEQWRKVDELFHEALDLPQPERISWAEQAAADADVKQELLSLLESDRQAQGTVERNVKSAVTAMFDGRSDEKPQRVGPYRLLRELGRGGMGTVYLAERDDEQYHSQVAIKLVRPGMDTDFILHRFRQERQILAQLEHPHIARLLDGGTTNDGRPYIVMEYVPGLPITEYAHERGLDTTERLTLFLDVCSAVEYAHQHFVVHRDLKPGNILINEHGIAKLVDFGICKLLHSEPATHDTAVGTVQMLTPEYASPEQVRGEPITIGSDIYSLTAVLYELLTGYKPHRIEKFEPDAVERAICEHEVIRPSLVPDKALARKLKGDLDNILLRGLQKDRARRYASVEQLSDDIRRYLAYEPVRARPDTLGYRVRKFLRRERSLVLACSLAAVCLLAGIVVSVREATIARENLLEARRLANGFVFDVHDAVRDLPGSTRARQLIVETGLRYLDGLARNSRRDWDLKLELANAYQRIGDVQGNVMGANLGNTKGALESYRKAMALIEAILRHEPSDRGAQLARVGVLRRVGSVHMYTGETGRALDSLREAQVAGEALLTQYPGDVQVAGELGQVYTACGDALSLSGALGEALQEQSKAVALLESFSSAVSNDPSMKQTLAAAYSAMGIDETRLGRPEEGLTHYRRALPILEELARKEPANASYQRAIMSVYSHLGDALGNPKWRSLGDAEGAFKAYQQMLAVARRLHETDPANQQATSDYAIALTRVAAVLLPGPGQPAEKLAMLRESLRLLREIEQVNPENQINRWDLSHGYAILGDALIASDRAAAIEAYKESINLGEALLASGMNSPAPEVVNVHETLGVLAAQDGDRTTAVQHAERVLELSDPQGNAAQGRSENVQRFLTPRGSAAMGRVYAALARSKSTPAAVAAEDRRNAQKWLEQSLAKWRPLEADPAFAPAHREELQKVEEAAAQVRTP
jgi:tetratricopeptide (TPR) repeat protein